MLHLSDGYNLPMHLHVPGPHPLPPLYRPTVERTEQIGVCHLPSGSAHTPGRMKRRRQGNCMLPVVKPQAFRSGCSTRRKGLQEPQLHTSFCCCSAWAVAAVLLASAANGVCTAVLGFSWHTTVIQEDVVEGWPRALSSGGKSSGLTLKAARPRETSGEPGLWLSVIGLTLQCL